MITAKTINDLLLSKHSKDICVPDCKLADSGSRIMDMWVMKPSWATPVFWGYEIKVARNDFLRDEKWRKYLPFCTDFYFAAPPGIISPDELPAECGLMVTSINGKMLYTKKKAPHRAVDIPISIFKYVLMWRSKITRVEPFDRHNYWKSYVEDKLKKHEIGQLAGFKIKQAVDQKVAEIKAENRRLFDENLKLNSIKKILSDFGYQEKDISSYGLEYSFKKKIEQIKGGGLLEAVQDVQQKLSDIEKIISQCPE